MPENTKNNDDGGPAYPQPDWSAYGIGPNATKGGMTLRDYFAAKALPVVMDVWDRHAKEEGQAWDAPGHIERIGAVAYEFADAMILARAASPSPSAKTINAELLAVVKQLLQLFDEYGHIQPWYQGQNQPCTILSNAKAAVASAEGSK